MNSEYLNACDWEVKNARDYHIEFMKSCWRKTDPFIVGFHTESLCNKIDSVVKRYKDGESVFLKVKMPVRHGKTDIISRYLPPHLLGLFPDDEILIATHSQSFSNKLSRFARDIIETKQYMKLFPTIHLSKDSYSVENWKLQFHLGSTSWTGIGGGITGEGYNFGIIDDFIKGIEQAESALIRDKQWDWFTNNFLTRRTEPSVTMILATPWHVDDIIGRIEDKNNKDHKDYDSEFPLFEDITFPAFSEDYEEGVLFPKKYSKKWYYTQRASLGTSMASALLQCNPVVRGGNFLRADNVKIVENMPIDLSWCRVWDLASTEKERSKSDPDYTVGTLMAIDYIKNKEDVEIPRLYIKHILRGQWAGNKRNDLILRQTEADGDKVRIGVECIGAYKDAHDYLQGLLVGKRVIQQIVPSKDKIVRAQPLEAVFESGNIFIMKGEWNNDFLDEVAAFPKGKHDDIVDTLSNGYEMIKKMKNIVIGNFNVNADGSEGGDDERKSLI